MKRRGFTLLELILGLAITVMIAGTLAAAFHVGFRARASAQRAILAARTTGLLTQIISRDFESALQPSGILASDFTGAADTVTFCTTTPEPRATVPGDIKRVEYGLLTADNGRVDLARRVQPNLLQSVETEPDAEIICRGVSNLQFSYYDSLEWTDTWDPSAHSNTLPTAVHIALDILPATEDGTPLHYEQYLQIACAKPTTQDSGSTQ